MVTIKLMRYTGIPQVINKQPTTVHTIQGTFRQPYSLMNPVVELAGNTIQDLLYNNQTNYAMIDDKYYYIMDWKIMANNYTEVILHLDVLMTYKTEIGKLHVTLERSSNPSNRDIPDNMFPLSSNRTFETITFPNQWSGDEKDGTYIMVTNQTGYEIDYGGGVE